jgi:hypothetical protein
MMASFIAEEPSHDRASFCAFACRSSPADDRGHERARVLCQDAAGLFAYRYSRIVAANPPDGIIIEESGAVHLHGGGIPMLNDMVDQLAAADITARAAMADSWGALTLSHAM